jgi:hypothetical protein
VPREAPYAARVAPRPALARGAIRRSFVNITWVVEVRLDRRRRATKPIGDLHDRQTVKLAVVLRQCDRAASLDDPIEHNP